LMRQSGVLWFDRVLIYHFAQRSIHTRPNIPPAATRLQGEKPVCNQSIRLGVLLASMAACATWLTWDAGGQTAVKVKLPSLDPVLGKNADGAWLYVSGSYTIAADPGLGKQVLTVDKTALVLDSKAPGNGARSIKALVRLKASPAVPNAAASFSVGRKDA